jgi:hypothetical protein
MTTQDLVFRWARQKRQKERFGWIRTAALWTMGVPLVLVACLFDGSLGGGGILQKESPHGCAPAGKRNDLTHCGRRRLRCRSASNLPLLRNDYFFGFCSR